MKRFLLIVVAATLAISIWERGYSKEINSIKLDAATNSSEVGNINAGELFIHGHMVHGIGTMSVDIDGKTLHEVVSCLVLDISG